MRFERRGRWAAWRPLHAGELHRPGLRASELISAGGASRYQIRLPAGGGRARATAIAVRSSHADAASSAPPWPETLRHRLPLSRGCSRTRAQWGADEGLRFDAAGHEKWAPAYFEVQRLTLHHTATEGGGADGSDPVGLVQAIYRYHAIDLNFGDIGYQLLIDRDGCVYEGRYSGDDGTPVYGARQPGPAPAAVNAGHTLGFNAGNVGVALIGNFNEGPPTARALGAATRTLAGLARRAGLDPLSTGTYVNPITGATKDVPVISGHRDWLATECPGEYLYALLPALRERVARRLAAPVAF